MLVVLTTLVQQPSEIISGASFNVTGFKESDLVVTGATGNDSVKETIRYR
jgi:hypothetical protein